MHFFCFNKFVTLFMCFPFFEILAEKTYNSLVITINEHELKLTKPIYYKDNYKNTEFTAPQEGNTYHLCPLSDQRTNLPSDEKFRNVLIFSELIEPKTISSDKNRCLNSITPYMLKVKNPNELRSNWNHNDGIELYHSAYVLKEHDSKEKIENVVQVPEYETWPSNYISILGIEIFFNTISRETVAVSYKLLSAPLQPNRYNYPSYKYEPTPPLENPGFMKLLDEVSDAKFLEGKLGKEADKYMEGQKKGFLNTFPFAPSRHFAIPLWVKPTQVRLNLFPIWFKVSWNWMEVDKFAEIVASYLGDLTVTAGITGTMHMSIPNSEYNSPEATDSSKLEGKSPKQQKPEFKEVLFEDENEKFRLPNYVWKAFELNDHGILVVMHFNPFVKTTERICDEDVSKRNGWIVSNSYFRTGEIYCCDMTTENIKRLQADFLSLTEKKPFAIKKDSEGKFFLVTGPQ